MKVINQYLKIFKYLHLSVNKLPSIQYKFWVSLVLWNHNNGEHCWFGNGPEDDHWHPSQRGYVTEGLYWRGGGGAVQGVLHQSILNAKLTGRKKFGWKMCTSNRDDPKLENAVKQSRFKHLGHFQKHLTWAKEKNNWTVAQWSKDLFSDESKFCISFGNQGPRVWRKSGEAQNPCSLKSSVKFPQSVMIWAAMSSAGVGPLCFLKSTVNAAIYQEILEHFMLPSAVKLYGDAGFIFQ